LAQSAPLALELILDELEIEHAADTEDEPSDAEGKKLPRTARKREPFPKGLKRVQKTIAPSDACTNCGGSFKVLGTDVMEELEYISGHYVVNQISRPRLACTWCETVVQAKISSRPIPKSFVGPTLMAHILCCNYGYHLPLDRQSQIFRTKASISADRLWPVRSANVPNCCKRALAWPEHHQNRAAMALCQKRRYLG